MLKVGKDKITGRNKGQYLATTPQQEMNVNNNDDNDADSSNNDNALDGRNQLQII